MPLPIGAVGVDACVSMVDRQKLLRAVPLGAGLIAAALVVGAFVFQDSLFRMAATPPGRFASAAVPPNPDYSRTESWALRPEIQPAGAWERPWGVDVFFIHPTTAYAGDAWNAAIDDRAAARRLDESILPNHAGPFQHAGPVYAPRYRQASLYSEISVGHGGDGAFLIAYNDVLAAFDEYVATDNQSRAIILVGIGQGGLLAERLLKERFQDGALKERLAAAYIIDAGLPLDMLGGEISQPACREHEDIHCVVAWKSVIAGDGGAARRFRNTTPVWTADGKIEVAKGRPLLCVNPLLWNTSADLAPKADHRGGARADGPLGADPQILERSVSARCSNGVLSVDRPSDPKLQADNAWGGRYKTPTFNLFYADIAFNAAERARAASVWLDENGRKPAKPLPPAFTLSDAPIHREDGVVYPVER
jgi:hypothetical protein